MKSVFILCFFVFSFNVLAQHEGGGLTYSEGHSKWEFGLGLNMLVDSDRGFVLNLNPSAQYFVFKNLSVGGFLQFYSDDNLRFYSVGPSGTFFLLRANPYSIVLNQRIRFRDYIKPDNVNAASTVSLTTLAGEYNVGRGLTARLGIGYQRSFDGSPLGTDGDKEAEWIFPTFGVAYYL